MRYRTLGSSGIQVSEISLGSWLTFSGGIELEHTRACTNRAFDAGITFFDTANVYGQGASELAWGEILSGDQRLHRRGRIPHSQQALDILASWTATLDQEATARKEHHT
jgi:aryl-alcohol dehydrogenase-like predicted oxidoreductase